LHRASDGGHLSTFKAASLEFIDENGGGPVLRLRKPPKQKEVKIGAVFMMLLPKPAAEPVTCRKVLWRLGENDTVNIG
jgi:hypothetical protein